MPIAASFLAVFEPIPQSASVGRDPIHSAHRSEVNRKTPAGLPASVAIFAWSLLSPIPIEHQSSVRSTTRRWISPARLSGSSVSTATNASSHPITCTTKPKDRSVSITRRDASR
jgi:hypothetical protein